MPKWLSTHIFLIHLMKYFAFYSSKVNLILWRGYKLHQETHYRVLHSAVPSCWLSSSLAFMRARSTCLFDSSRCPFDSSRCCVLVFLRCKVLIKMNCLQPVQLLRLTLIRVLEVIVVKEHIYMKNIIDLYNIKRIL